MTLTKETLLEQLLTAYSGPGSTEEGSFAGDVLRACADVMAELWSTEIDGLEYRAFVSTACGEWLTQVCADRGVARREGESDAELRARTLEKLASQPASGNADHYAAWCGEVEGILRVKVLPQTRGHGTVDIVAVNSEGKAPAQATLQAAQAIVSARRPIGADAQVIAASETALTISAQVKLAGTAVLSAVQTAFAAQLAAFCKESALRTTTVSYARILQLLLETQGVADVVSLTLNGGTLSLSLEDTQVPVPGTITLTEAST